jgi:hypothetical protein
MGQATIGKLWPSRTPARDSFFCPGESPLCDLRRPPYGRDRGTGVSGGGIVITTQRTENDSGAKNVSSVLAEVAVVVMSGSVRTAICECGRIEVSLFGNPIACVICHCDDCQRFARRPEGAEPLGRICDASGGTPYVMYRADRVEIIRGGELLEDHKLTDGTATRRAVATCCGAPVLLRFDRGPHWVSIYRQRMKNPPDPEMRVQTRYMPASAIRGELPAYRHFPLSLFARLVVAKLAMLLPVPRR